MGSAVRRTYDGDMCETGQQRILAQFCAQQVLVIRGSSRSRTPPGEQASNP